MVSAVPRPLPLHATRLPISALCAGQNYGKTSSDNDRRSACRENSSRRAERLFFLCGIIFFLCEIDIFLCEIDISLCELYRLTFVKKMSHSCATVFSLTCKRLRTVVRRLDHACANTCSYTCDDLFTSVRQRKTWRKILSSRRKMIGSRREIALLRRESGCSWRDTIALPQPLPSIRHCWSTFWANFLRKSKNIVYLQSIDERTSFR